MKNLLLLVIVGGVGLGVGFFAGKLSNNYSISINPNKPLIETIGQPPSSVLNPNSSKTDKYEIVWDGKKGEKFTGIYVVMDMTGSSPRIEKLDAILPYKITLSLKTGSIISADSSMSGVFPSTAKIKIYKNGKDCGKKAFTGSGADFISGLVCQ
jgi:hypothetical protein